MDKPNRGRIPQSLQEVFIASNGGKEVHRPPPNRVATRTFFRNPRFFQGLRQMGPKRTCSPPPPQTNCERNHRRRSSTSTSKESASPPSVISASSSGSEKTPEQTKRPTRTNTHRRKPSQRPPMCPQAYLDLMISSRGYPTRRYRALHTGYYAKPTDFQQASHHVNLVNMVRSNDLKALREIFDAGISPNPCNAYGESLLHMVCRRGDTDALEMMLEAGASVQVSDDYGRTPLHDACWRDPPSFATVELVASRDLTLFHVTDSRGAVPLSYAGREYWGEWIAFLKSKKDEWWPPVSGEYCPSPLVDEDPDERPVPTPSNALSIELAAMVVAGKLSPAEARILLEDGGEDSDSSDDYDDETTLHFSGLYLDVNSDSDSDESESTEDDSDDYDASSLESESESNDDEDGSEFFFDPADLQHMMGLLSRAKHQGISRPW